MFSSSPTPAASAPPAGINAWLGTAGVLLLAAWLAALEGGYFSHEFFTAAIISWALLGLLVLVAWDHLQLPATSLPSLTALALILVWTGLSSIWSISPNSSLQEFARVAIYFAGFIAVLTGPRTRRSAGLAVTIFVALVTAIAAFALLAKIGPAYSEEYTYAGGRLMGSLGYWNALAIFMVIGMLPCLWFTIAPETRRAGRVVATMALALMGTTLFFTLSRGGIFIGLLAILLFLLLTPRRLGLLLSLGSAAAPVAVLAWRTMTSLPTLHAAEEGFRIDAAEGRQFAWMLLATLAVTALLKTATLWLPERMPATARSRLLILFFWLAVILVASGLCLSQRDRISAQLSSWRNQSGSQVTASGDLSIETRGVGRLVATSDQRPELWRIGLNNFREHPLLGTGAGTYRFANMRLQSGAGLARDPHSIWVRFLSDQGIIGFSLLLVLMAALAFALIKPLWRDAGLRRDGLYLSLVIAAGAWVADSGLEWNWELPVMALAFFLIAGLALRVGTAGTTGDIRLPVWARLSVLPPAMILTFAFLSMLASTVFVDTARENLDAGDRDAAASAASRAGRLNRYATEPLVIKSRIAMAVADFPAARDDLLAAVQLEPDKSSLYEKLAVLEFYDMKMTDDGIASLSRAIDFDPQYRPLHLILHRMVADGEKFARSGIMPPPPEIAE